MNIYKLTSPSHKVYIGQATNVLARWRKHEQNAKANKAGFLYSAIRKYGWDSFDKEVIDHASSKEELNQKEIYWIAFYESQNPEKGYNMTEGGEGRCGGTNSPEHRKRISESTKGRKISLETRQKISKTLSGKYHRTPETRKKIGQLAASWVWIKKENEANKRVTQEKLQEFLEAGWTLGRNSLPCSEETKKKIGQANKGKKLPPISEETREKLRASSTGRILSEEARKKISIARRKNYIIKKEENYVRNS